MASDTTHTNKKERNKMTPEQKKQLIAARESGDPKIGAESVKKEFARLLEIERLAIAFITTTRCRAGDGLLFASDVGGFALAIVENLKTKEIK